MKKTGILNADIAAVVAGIGHLDTLTVADAGLPIPDNVRRIDLVVRPNQPRFMEVTSAIFEELTVQEAIIAREMTEVSPHIYDALCALLGKAAICMVTHSEFKQLTAQSKAVVRSGEFTPYANVILVAGVTF